MNVKGTFATRELGLAQRVRLNNGVGMPWLGLGVFRMENDAETERVALEAIASGYRSIDTAALYENERGVGAAVRNSGVAREDLFVTSKVWNPDIRADRVEAAFEESMERLGLDYVDLYLLHWPIEGKIVQSWKALEKFYQDGRIRAIGVSNHLERHIEEILTACEIPPAVNQIEYHPYLQSPVLKAFCEAKGIRLEAWSPFMHGGAILTDPILTEIGAMYGKTAAQVIVRWILQTGVATIPKSVRSERIVENSDVFDFELSDQDMSKIALLERKERWGADPDNFDF
ncbi:oxidoreductase, aldo/keto reductase family [Verrucomicrobiia bacterium DG1235]|nr:oxidoreductase, aldo/keto reductase family [Verrucomicrobiae bacterium DG1235]